MSSPRTRSRTLQEIDHLKDKQRRDEAAHGAAVLVSSPLPPGTTRPKLVVGGAALQCANESAVIDGTHLPKRGWATHGVPCFLWDTEAAWSEPFAAEDAVRFFERGDGNRSRWNSC